MLRTPKKKNILPGEKSEGLELSIYMQSIMDWAFPEGKNSINTDIIA